MEILMKYTFYINRNRLQNKKDFKTKNKGYFIMAKM